MEKCIFQNKTPKADYGSLWGMETVLKVYLIIMEFLIELNVESGQATFSSVLIWYFFTISTAVSKAQINILFAKSVLFYLLLINWTKNEQFQKNTETTEGQTVRTTNIVNLHTRQLQHPWGERQFYSLINYRLLRGNRVLKFISLFKKSNSSKHVHIKIPFTPL